MVSPITGPHIFKRIYRGPPNNYGYTAEERFLQRTYWRQKRPYIDPLPFVMTNRMITLRINSQEFTYSHASIPATDVSRESQRLYNAAYSSFIGKVKTDAAELATTLVEWKKSEAMIYDRATKLINGIRAAKRGDVKALKRLWGKGAGIRRNLKQQGSNVLEYSFGWAPLVGDIASATAVLGNGIPSPVVKARRSAVYSFQSVSSNSYSREVTNESVSIGWNLRATVIVTNPNLFLANQLGLTNPASVLWEITPWSFALDYIVNVSDFLASFTDLLGVQLAHECRTRMITRNSTRITYNTTKAGYILPGFGGQIIEVERSVGIPGPTLTLRPPWRMSVSRASTSVALLLQKLGR